MKRVRLLGFVLAFVFVCSGICFAQNETKIKGTVIKIEGSLMTIRDDKGRERTFEGNTTGIKVGDSVLVTTTIEWLGSPDVRSKLNPEEIDFLATRCQANRDDIDIIPQLNDKGRRKLFSFIEKRDCSQLNGFKATRNYYRQLRIDKPIPLPPIGWDTNYLTAQEFQQYMNIMENAPW